MFEKYAVQTVPSLPAIQHLTNKFYFIGSRFQKDFSWDRPVMINEVY